MASKAKKDHRFTEEEKNFLRENISDYTYSQLAEVFNERFGTNLTHGNISDVCLKRMGIKRNKPYAFKKGKKTFNAYPIGTEIFDGWLTWLKISDEYEEGTGRWKYQSVNWVKKHIYVYENVCGKIPDGHILIFLDKNKQNCNIDNLYCVSRKVGLMIGKNKWHTENRETTLTAIKWCKLFYAMKDRMEVT